MIELKTNKISTLPSFFLLVIPQIVAAAEGTPRDTWETILINWFPMLLLIGVWIYFMRNMRKRRGNWQSWGGEETNKQLEKIAQALEHIARALEKK